MKIYDYAGKKNISGERIREARTRLHLTQTNLAVQLKLVGVDVERDSISKPYRNWNTICYRLRNSRIIKNFESYSHMASWDGVTKRKV